MIKAKEYAMMSFMILLKWLWVPAIFVENSFILVATSFIFFVCFTVNPVRNLYLLVLRFKVKSRFQKILFYLSYPIESFMMRRYYFYECENSHKRVSAILIAGLNDKQFRIKNDIVSWFPSNELAESIVIVFGSKESVTKFFLKTNLYRV